jgi:putative mRNA 3-end processing factor
MCPPGPALVTAGRRRFGDPVTAMASGWMRVRARARQRGAELPLIVSDHADWDDLCRTILETGAGQDLGDPRRGGGACALVRIEWTKGASRSI